MKKNFALLLLLPALFLASCSDDDNNGGGENPGLDLVGKWDFEKFEMEVKTSEQGATDLLTEIYSKELKIAFTDSRYEFTADKTFTFYSFKEGAGFEKVYDGTYKLEKDQLTLSNPVGEDPAHRITIADGFLTIMAQEMSGSKVLESEEYPGWENVEVKSVREDLYFKKVK